MDPPLPIDGVLPPDLQGTLLRIGPTAGAGAGGALHAIELRDGTAVSYTTCESAADANVLWHAGSVLALAESGLPQQFSRSLEPEEFDGGPTIPIASHVHRDARSGGRVLFGVDDGAETTLLRIGEWDRAGALTHQMAVALERATWQHDTGVTAGHVVFIESPTEHGADLAAAGCAVPFRWTPGAEGWVGVVARGGDGSAVRWIRLDPCLVTHVLGAYDEPGDGGAIVLYVCRYEVPEKGQPIDPDASVVGAAGIGESVIGPGLAVLERWRIEGETLERAQVDDRLVEYGRADPLCETLPFRYGYCVEVAGGLGGDGEVDHLGLLRFDLDRDEVEAWSPGPYRTASEPLFVRAVDGRSDDEGWLLTVVHDATRGASDLYVLDASSWRGRPQAVVHLPAALPFRSHGTWVGADLYR
jgi:carotenoid cleavage dioxygenase